MNDYIVEMKKIRKTFGEVQAVKKGEFNLKKGEIHSLIGENGAGKSTMMKMLYGMYGIDPFIAFGEYGKGRSAVFTTDCAPHWAPPEFCEWEDYNNVWAGIVDWLTE